MIDKIEESIMNNNNLTNQERITLLSNYIQDKITVEKYNDLQLPFSHRVYIKKLEKNLQKVGSELLATENLYVEKVKNTLKLEQEYDIQINNLKQKLKVHGLHQLDEYVTLRTIVSNFKNWQAEMEIEANTPDQEKNHKFSPSAVDYYLKKILGIEDGSKK